MMLEFVKFDAAGNDLIVADIRGLESPPSMADLATRLCDRHFGVGSDGLLTVSERESLPFVRMYNPDGSEDFCGNGMRCVAAFLAGERLAAPMEMMTPFGRHKASIRQVRAREYDVRVSLLTPRFAPQDVPVRLDGERILDRPIRIGDAELRMSCVNTGSTHTVIFGEEDVSEETFQTISPLLETHEVFPERTSVLWCRAEGRERIAMRIWERAVGETLACGSGACAAVVVGKALGRTVDEAEVVTRGGRMSARWHGRGPVELRGPARIVYRGRLNPFWENG